MIPGLNFSFPYVVPGCGSLPDPANGQVTLTGTTVGSEATYTCNPGYTLWGDQTRQCRSGGQWSGSEPTCERMFRLSLYLIIVYYLNLVRGL